MTRTSLLVTLVLLFLLSHSSWAWIATGGVASSWMRVPSSVLGLNYGRSSASHMLLLRAETNEADEELDEDDKPKSRYQLGVGKNRPVVPTYEDTQQQEVQQEEKEPPLVNITSNWMAPDPVAKPPRKQTYDLGAGKHAAPKTKSMLRTKRVLMKKDNDKRLKGALWHEDHYTKEEEENHDSSVSDTSTTADTTPASITSQQQQQQSSLEEEYSVSYVAAARVLKPAVLYPDIDLSIPDTVYDESNSIDAVWDLLRYEAHCEAQREPLLVSFLHSTILNHDTLESALAFHLANKLASPAMISTQIQSLVLEALENSLEFRRNMRADMMAVRDRDPACTCLPDVFLYFKGFHALQTHRVGNYMYKSGRKVLAHYLQSQMSTNFQIDIHPNATMGSGIMLDHGTGIVVGETATVGHNCSILHHVTLGGSGKKGVDRHPKVGNGVLLGAGVSVLGNVLIGDGCQVGAGTLVISDLPPHSVAVGVPARIIGSFVDVTVQPSLDMNQMMGSQDFDRNIIFESDGI